ncbi:MAG: tetratricopeptide repeat protein [Candidatus Omnitrophica bacterium]|nr:tetratricopeptide repeat protein [Candidatus Omnitrophota bacterium]
MSIDFFRKLNWAFGLIALGILFGVILFAATVEVKDLDLWLHLRMGEYIVRYGYVPSFDVLSASFFGQPWVNHEWLFQVVVHLVRQGWGMDGLIYMQAGLVLVTFLLALLLVYDKDRQLVLIPFLFLVLQIYQTRFTIRPDIFSLFFFICYIVILSSHLHKRWSVWALFILQVIWTNMHGYSLWGIIFVLIGLAAEALKRRVPLPYQWNVIGRLTDDEFQRLGLIAAALLAAMFFNPMGLEGALYPVRTLIGITGDSRVFFDSITELQRSLSWNTLFNIDDQWAFKSLIVLSFISFIFNRRKLDISALMLWLVFLLFSISAVRNMTYFAFAAFLVTGYNLAEVRFRDVVPLRFRNIKFFFLTGTAGAFFLALYLVDFGNNLAERGYYDFDKYRQKSEFLGVSQRNFPDKAAQFLIDKKITGNFFNDFNSGAYLVGRVCPGVMVYIDGRTELRGPVFFKEYQKIWNNGDAQAFEAVVRRYNLTGAFINTSGHFASEKFLKMLAGKPEWKPVYFDYDALVLLKDVPGNRQWIKQYGINLASWKPVELNLQELGPARVVPYRYVRRARTLYDMGFVDPAVREAQAALRVLPAYDEAFRILGDAASKKGDIIKAFEYYRLVCAHAGGDALARKKLAMAYLTLNNPAKAVEQARLAVELDGSSVEYKYALARALAKNKQFKEGYDILVPILADQKDSSGIKEKAGVLLKEIKLHMEKK